MTTLSAKNYSDPISSGVNNEVIHHGLEQDLHERLCSGCAPEASRMELNPAQTQLALGSFQGSLRDSCKLMQRLKGAFALHMGCPGMRLCHHGRVPSLPFCRHVQEYKRPEGYSNDTSTMFPRAGFSDSHFASVFFDMTSRSACSNWNSDTVPHLEPPTCISPRPHRCNILVQAGVSQKKKKKQLTEPT